MELWIRSQSKEKLVKIENIYISDEIRDGRAIMGCNSAFINQDLGTYATKERALEILDKIETKMAYINDEYVIGHNNLMIFEMPKE